MSKVVDWIDKIIDDHEQIDQNFQSLRKVNSDMDAIAVLEGSADNLVPRRLEDQKLGAKKLQENLELIDKGLQEHFQHEEQGILSAFGKDADMVYATAFRTLFTEHADIKERLTKSRKDLDELMTETLSRELWEGKFWGIRAYMNHTAKLIEAHAHSEHELMKTVKQQISKD